jgi:hypothetical protein
MAFVEKSLSADRIVARLRQCVSSEESFHSYFKVRQLRSWHD